MKFEEKHRRTVCKTKIAAMLLLSASYVGFMMMIDTPHDGQWLETTRWSSGTGFLDYNELTCDTSSGGMGWQYTMTRNIEPFRESTPEEKRILMRMRNGKVLIPRMIKGYPETSKSFAGFGYLRKSGKNVGAGEVYEIWGFVIPDWFPLVAPALLILHWCRQLRNGRQKTLGFPVVAKENAPQPAAIGERRAV